MRLALGPDRRSVAVTLVLDVVAVLVFVLVGRSNHDGGDAFTPGGIASTAWPFLVGLGVGWLVVAATVRTLPALRSGAVVWVSTVLVGMVLRAVSGQGVAVSFVVVTLIVLGVLLLGTRAVAARLHRRR